MATFRGWLALVLVLAWALPAGAQEEDAPTPPPPAKEEKSEKPLAPKEGEAKESDKKQGDKKDVEPKDVEKTPLKKEPARKSGEKTGAAKKEPAKKEPPKKDENSPPPAGDDAGDKPPAKKESSKDEPGKKEPAKDAPAANKDKEKDKKTTADFETITDDYLVVKDGAVLRDAPRANGAKLAALDVGARIEATGRSRNGEWVAARHDGKDGFLPGAQLVRLLNGQLDKDITGRANPANGPDCQYVIRFDGRSRVEGEIMDTADYWVSFKCGYRGRPLNFTAFMFMTEAAYDLSTKEIHQISVEVNDAGAEYDESLSATLMYHRAKGELSFDGAAPKAFAASGVPTKRPAKDIAEALRGAVDMALAAWNQEAWKELAKH